MPFFIWQTSENCGLHQKTTDTITNPDIWSE